MEQIEFIEVEDVRFPGRKILIGKTDRGTFHASYRGRREQAEEAIRQKFSTTARPFMGDKDGWGDTHAKVELIDDDAAHAKLNSERCPGCHRVDCHCGTD